MYPHDALCFLSGLSLIMMVVIRYISKLLVWILTVLVIIGSIGNFHKQHACSSTLNTYPSNSVWHFKNALRIYLSSCLSLLHYADKKKTVPDVFVFRWYVNTFLLWSFAGGTAVLWWLYVDHRNALNNNTLSVFGKEVASDNVTALLVYAIGATIFTVCLNAQVLYVCMHFVVEHILYLSLESNLCFFMIYLTKYIKYTNSVLNNSISSLISVSPSR